MLNFNTLQYRTVMYNYVIAGREIGRPEKPSNTVQ